MKTYPRRIITSSIRRTKHTSPAQFARRNAFRAARNFWFSSVSVAQKKAWAAYATYPQTNFHAFMSVNIMRAFNGVDCVADPPEQPQ